jgi:hypothetical protein
VYFKGNAYTLSPFPNVECDEQIFFPFGSALTTQEHGIGEHLSRIQKYFPTTKIIMPLILPTHREPSVSWGREGKLRIASVDFSHYLPEATARDNDQISIQTLQSGTGTWSDFRPLDVDCPACLFTLQQRATPDLQQAHLYYRDSSSTIL